MWTDETHCKKGAKHNYSRRSLITGTEQCAIYLHATEVVASSSGYSVLRVHVHHDHVQVQNSMNLLASCE